MGSGRNRIGGAIVLVLGIFTLGTAVFFLVLRPPLLPEDIRHTGIDPGVLTDEFLGWLSIVFRTWGGFIAGYALALLGIGLFAMTGQRRWLYWPAALGIVVAFGRFFYSNIVLSSDFLWFISFLFLLALVAATLLAFSRDRPPG